jgi:hypothetical protein
LDQYLPATYKNWLALFLGSHANYTGTYVKKVAIPTDSPDGYANIEGLKLLIGTTYAVGYFMADESTATGRTSLSASSTFTVGQTG